MERAAISYLNQHTREVLDRVREGHAVEITERGRPIARIVPIRPDLPPGVQAMIDRGEAQAPLIRGPIPLPTGPIDHERRASRALQELRDLEGDR
jgi:prevent-host-death family protein